MTRTKLSLMGLCAVAIGVMAMSASSAQAALSWLVLDVNGEALEIKGTPVNLLVELVAKKDTEHIVLLATIAKTMISVVCTGVELLNIHLAAAGALSTGGVVHFTGCAVYAGTFSQPLSNVLNTTRLSCTISGGGGAAGTITTNKGKGKLVLSEGQLLTLLEPETGETFVTLEFKGSECSLPAEDPIKGVLDLKDCLGDPTTHLVAHLVEAGAGTIINLGTAKAELLGSVWLELGGAHKGLAWSAMDV